MKPLQDSSPVKTAPAGGSSKPATPAAVKPKVPATVFQKPIAGNDSGSGKTVPAPQHDSQAPSHTTHGSADDSSAIKQGPTVAASASSSGSKTNDPDRKVPPAITAPATPGAGSAKSDQTVKPDDTQHTGKRDTQIASLKVQLAQQQANLAQIQSQADVHQTAQAKKDQDERDAANATQTKLAAASAQVAATQQGLSNAQTLNFLANSAYANGTKMSTDAGNNIKNGNIVVKPMALDADSEYNPDTDSVDLSQSSIDAIHAQQVALEKQGVVDADGRVLSAKALTSSSAQHALVVSQALIGVHEFVHAADHESGTDQQTTAAVTPAVDQATAAQAQLNGAHAENRAAESDVQATHGQELVATAAQDKSGADAGVLTQVVSHQEYDAYHAQELYQYEAGQPPTQNGWMTIGNDGKPLAKPQAQANIIQHMGTSLDSQVTVQTEQDPTYGGTADANASDPGRNNYGSVDPGRNNYGSDDPGRNNYGTADPGRNNYGSDDPGRNNY